MNRRQRIYLTGMLMNALAFYTAESMTTVTICGFVMTIMAALFMLDGGEK